MHKALVVLTPGFPKDVWDTTCVPAMHTFVKALKQTQPDLEIIVLTFQYPFYADEYNWHGVKVIAIGGQEKGRLHRAITWVKAWSILRNLNRQYKLIGLLSLWLGEAAFIGHRFAKKYKLKHYTWLQGQDAKRGNKYAKWIKPKPDSLIALSDFIKHEFDKNYGVTPAYLVPVGVDTTLFKPIREVKDIDIIGAGSLIPLKQYSVFVDIITNLKKDFPTIKTIICGAGPEMKMLREKIQNLGLNANIRLTGELPHAEVLALMQRSKIFMHTSNYEGFGVVCLEALYAGAKVISFVKPMDQQIANWHIAAEKTAMTNMAAGILRDANTKYIAVLPFTIEGNAAAIMKLFT